MPRIIVSTAEPERSTAPPIFVDGAPVNLEAAALDAMEWLRFTRGYMRNRGQNRREGGGFRFISFPQEDMDRLDRAIAAMEKFLPEAEPEHRTTHA